MVKFSSITKYIPKAIGATALGIAAYDAHVMGKIQSDVYAKAKDAEACIDAFSNTQYLSDASVTTSALKKGWFNLEM